MAKPVQQMNDFSDNRFYGTCDHCEKRISKSLLIFDGGFQLCAPCKMYMDNEYEIMLRKEEEEWKQPGV